MSDDRKNRIKWTLNVELRSYICLGLLEFFFRAARLTVMFTWNSYSNSSCLCWAQYRSDLLRWPLASEICPLVNLKLHILFIAQWQSCEHIKYEPHLWHSLVVQACANVWPFEKRRIELFTKYFNFTKRFQSCKILFYPLGIVGNGFGLVCKWYIQYCF